MSVWDQLVGQNNAIDVFRAAAQAELAPTKAAVAPAKGELAPASAALAPTASHTPDAVMTHSWLITGPPGSGRSNLAYSFAAALLCSQGGCGECRDCVQVAAKTHPDLSVLATERVIISIDEVRHLVQNSQYSPSASRYRVNVIEDADRMAERTSNVLLKALEEPPERTVWILCAPSEADVIPTIRSRVRSVRLQMPSVETVATLLAERDGIDASAAERAARHAQSHIGMALRLASNNEAAARRRETVEIALGIQNVRDAVMAAGRLVDIATEDGKALTEERDEEERKQFRQSMGVAEGDALPAGLRSQERVLEEQQKRRATRSLRDGLDRILVDLMSVYRDVLMLQMGVDGEIINSEWSEKLRDVASSTTPADTLGALEAVGQARDRIDSNVAPALACEAFLLETIRRKW